MAKLTQERLQALVHYDPETGIFTRRVTGGGSYAGSEAGARHIKGYISVSIKAKVYLAHRLAWFYMTGTWPISQIDHRDTDKANNRWRNLRLATNGQNHWNRGPQANNTSGLKGICLDKRNGRWVARIGVDGRQIHIGKYDTAPEAHAAYAAAARKYHGEFARTE